MSFKIYCGVDELLEFAIIAIATPCDTADVIISLSIDTGALLIMLSAIIPMALRSSNGNTASFPASARPMIAGFINNPPFLYQLTELLIR